MDSIFFAMIAAGGAATIIGSLMRRVEARRRAETTVVIEGDGAERFHVPATEIQRVRKFLAESEHANIPEPLKPAGV